MVVFPFVRDGHCTVVMLARTEYWVSRNMELNGALPTWYTMMYVDSLLEGRERCIQDATCALRTLYKQFP